MNSIEALLAFGAYLAFVAVIASAAAIQTQSSTQAELGMACAVLDYAATMKGVSLELPENDFTASNGVLYLNGESRECLHAVSLEKGLVVSDG